MAVPHEPVPISAMRMLLIHLIDAFRKREFGLRAIQELPDVGAMGPNDQQPEKGHDHLKAQAIARKIQGNRDGRPER